jgi:pyroglutamyl-peptidase
MRVLLLGFGPFPGAPRNPSAALAQKLARRRRPLLADLERRAHVLATTYAAVDRDLPKLLADKPDIVLVFGLAARRHHVCIEIRARNARSVLFPDAGGYRPQHSRIERGGPGSHVGRAPFLRLLGALRAEHVPARLSRDAGRYLCNYAYWRALAHAPDGRPLVQFVHIPAVTRNPRPHRRGARRAPSLAQLVRAAERLLIALAATSKANRPARGGARQPHSQPRPAARRPQRSEPSRK